MCPRLRILRDRIIRNMSEYRVPEAAAVLGVSDDTVRRLVEQGRLVARRSGPGGRLLVEGRSLAALAQEQATPTPDEGVTSARNRLTGIVTRVVRDTVMAQVEIQVGPYRIVSLISRAAADDLGLEPGVLASAVVKATAVSVEIRGRQQ